MPLKGTRVIHPSFQQHHAPVAEGAMTATVNLLDPSLPAETTYDRATGQTTVVPASPAFSRVPARVQRLSGRADPSDAVAQDVLQPPYLIAVPYPLKAEEGWIVHVLECPDDPELAGRRYTVQQVAYGSARIERDLFCEDE
jgi:hypothetical protein